MSQPQAETRFIELMAELFQMDEAEALDFGLYRIIRRQNREVGAFLGEILQASKANDIVLDCFGGSGSTAHAVINTNRLEKSHRKFITVEVNQYFETLIVPRLKKAGASSAWSLGKAKTVNGPSLFLRVQTLEQYDDTLASLAIEPETGQSADFDFDDPAFSLRYRLHRESQTLYCAVERFASPFGYTLKRVAGGGEAPSQPVDLVESLIYLLGLDVTRLYHEPPGVVILGHDRRGQTVAVFFRDCAHPQAVAWLQAQLAEHPADRVFTNDPAALAFEGCERFDRDHHPHARPVHGRHYRQPLAGWCQSGYALAGRDRNDDNPDQRRTAQRAKHY
jgi:adenine-specific DNA-methyltransferase